MIRPVLLLFVALFSTHVLSAQKVDLSVPKKVKGRIVFSSVLGASDRNYYLLRYDKKSSQSFVIERYSRNLLLQNNYEFKIDKDSRVNKIFYLNKNIYILYSSFDKERKRNYIYADILNESLSKIADAIELSSTNLKGNHDHFFYICEDILYSQICLTTIDSMSNEHIFFRIAMHDADLKLIASKKFSLSINNDFKLDKQYLADSNLFFIYTNTIGNKSKDKQKVSSLFQFDFNKRTSRNITMQWDSLRIEELIFNYDPLHDAYIVAGYFLGENELQKGLAYMLIRDDSDTRLHMRFHAFSGEVISSVMGKKNSGGILNFYPREIISRSDGGFILIGEYFNMHKEVYNDYYSYNNSYVRYFYQYADILITSVNPDGEIDWNKVIRKDQMTMNDNGYYSSFLLGVTENGINLIFNDGIQSRSEVLSYIVKPDGSIVHDILVRNNSFDGLSVPKIGAQVNYNELIIPAFNHKSAFLLLKITME
jgi:hypothetical protein